jgi:hypothetical protein
MKSAIREKFGLDYLSNVEVTEPLIDEAGLLALPEHKKPELLASRLYLILCYRKTENKPFSYLIYRGNEIVTNDAYFPDYYKFYLLP